MRGADPERADAVVSLDVPAASLFDAAALWNPVRKMRGRMDGAQKFPAGNFSNALQIVACGMTAMRSRAVNGLRRFLRSVHWQPRADSKGKASSWRIR